MLPRLAIILVLLAVILTAPFLFHPGDSRDQSGPEERLVIISPHNESIRAEFGRAFARHMSEGWGRSVEVDWRQPGGTSEIAMYLRSEVAKSFENLWRRETGGPPDARVMAAFADGKIDPDSAPTGELPARAIEARRLFLASDAGAGIDLFFGGGAYDFDRQAEAGLLVARDPSGRHGPAALREERPEWFADDVMPASASGEPFRDPELRWVGTVLSAFGICYNSDSLERLGIEEIPAAWADLADPRLFGQVAMADPAKSGSVTKAIEMIFQQQMQEAWRSGLAEEEAVAEGWDRAMRMMLRISGNSRYFTDQASKIPHDVAQGDAAAGMSIDFYGRTYHEKHLQPDGSSRVGFVMPEGGTSIGADPVGLLRGAPHPELAHRFIEFVLSPEGQKLWNYRAGEPGGPERTALRRPPIRRDFYVEENLARMSDPGLNPYEAAAAFDYQPAWTGGVFNALRFIIRCACVDTHREQRAAWRAIIEAGFPPEAVAVFDDVAAVSRAEASGRITAVLRSRNKIEEVELARELASRFRAQYREAERLARASRS